MLHNLMFHPKHPPQATQGPSKHCYCRLGTFLYTLCAQRLHKDGDVSPSRVMNSLASAMVWRDTHTLFVWAPVHRLGARSRRQPAGSSIRAIVKVCSSPERPALLCTRLQRSRLTHFA